jgi:5-methylcytosine-specific restriction endonuclease McrA
MHTDLYIYKKEIDWSALHLGVNIPISLQNIFYENIKIKLRKGENKKIKLLLDGWEYPAILTNIYFDETKYPTHKELLQIRWSPKSEIAQRLREIFSSSYSYLFDEKEKLTNKKKQLSVPEEMREYLAIYSTIFDDVFAIECITHGEIVETKQEIRKFNELELEQIIQATDTPAFIKKTKTTKIRKLDKIIGDNLKRLYDYKCQICGLFIGEAYNATVIHTHHIEYFSVSLNNNANNIMVICPNHHGIIHATNPVFNRETKHFTYPNGLSESLKLNLHL